MPVRSLCCPTLPTNSEKTLRCREILWISRTPDGSFLRFSFKTASLGFERSISPSEWTGCFCFPSPEGRRGVRGRCLWRKDTSPCDPFQKRGGVSISPPHPLTTQRGGAAAPPLWISLPGGVAAAEREVGPFNDHPRKKCRTIKCGGALSLFPRGIAHPVRACKSALHRPRLPPYLRST